MTGSFLRWWWLSALCSEFGHCHAQALQNAYLPTKFTIGLPISYVG